MNQTINKMYYYELLAKITFNIIRCKHFWPRFFRSKKDTRLKLQFYDRIDKTTLRPCRVLPSVLKFLGTSLVSPRSDYSCSFLSTSLKRPITCKSQMTGDRFNHPDRKATKCISRMLTDNPVSFSLTVSRR